MNWGPALIFFAVPFALFLLIELLILIRTDAQGGCLVPIGAAASLLFLAWLGYETALGWDALGWWLLMLGAACALAGSLLGGAVGLVLRRQRRRKEKHRYEADQTV